VGKWKVRLCFVALSLGLIAAAPAGRGADGHLAIEYGGWEKKQCRTKPVTGSWGPNRTDMPSAVPGRPPAQECEWCRTVRRCSFKDLRENPGRCVRGRECQKTDGPPPPSEGRGRSVG
jgi:hypothetical protein